MQVPTARPEIAEVLSAFAIEGHHLAGSCISLKVTLRIAHMVAAQIR
jgi:hypothetical protein